MLGVALLLVMTAYRALFMFLYASYAEGLSVADGLFTLVNGGAIDLSAVMLIMTVPWLIVALSTVWSAGVWWRRLLRGYLLLVTGGMAVIFAADVALYEVAGHRLDVAALGQLFEGSVPTWVLLRSVGVLLAAWGVSGYMMWLIVRGAIRWGKVTPPRKAVLPLALMLGVIVFGAGWGSGHIPRYGAAYFSSHPFMNAAAVNPTMSLVESALVRPDYSPMEALARRQKPKLRVPQQADSVAVDSVLVAVADTISVDSLVVDSLPRVESESQWQKLLLTERPNVLIIVMAGITQSDFDRVENGRYVMSHLNTLCSEGYLFENFYAVSEGEDNAALVAVTGGYMTLPGAANQDIPFKCERMTTLTAQLDSAGYRTEAWYGGDLLHNNMRAYLYGTGFDNVVDSHKLLVYGVMGSTDDAVVLPMLTERVMESEEPFFGVYLTNSMDADRRLPYTKYDDRRSNAAAFVDEQIGVMTRHLKYSGRWDNLLVVIVGDSDGQEVAVPMMMVGGAVDGFGVVERVGSQADLPRTLAAQMGLRPEEFRYGEDLASDDRVGEAYFTFSGGYGVAGEQGVVRYRVGQPYYGGESEGASAARYRLEEYVWGAYKELQER